GHQVEGEKTWDLHNIEDKKGHCSGKQPKKVSEKAAEGEGLEK
ncbi:hypothetical protein CCACVL1_31034, partial [Corchorus capsularis]